MAIRHFVIAALLAGAGAAQADVVATSGFQNSWTAGNGSSILGSGVLGNGVSLVGGVSHSTGLGSSLASGASASLSQADAQKLFVQQGIDASYVLSAGNGLLAARYGDAVSVINDGDGVKIIVNQNAGVTAPTPVAPAAPVAADPVGGSNGGESSDTGGGSAVLPIADNGPSLETPSADPIALLPGEVNAVPEPGTIALMLAGLAGAGLFQRRRNTK